MLTPFFTCYTRSKVGAGAVTKNLAGAAAEKMMHWTMFQTRVDIQNFAIRNNYFRTVPVFRDMVILFREIS
jgi:hypothetical protein